MPNIAKKAEQIVRPIIENLGYEVVEVSFKKISSQDTLEILIFRDGGVTLEDCIKVNDALDLPLEQHDITSGEAYNLNISSLGLDRPLVTERDYQRRIGEQIDIELVEERGGNKLFVGKLKDVDKGEIIINIKGRDTRINIENIKHAAVHIKFGGNNDK